MLKYEHSRLIFDMSLVWYFKEITFIVQFDSLGKRFVAADVFFNFSWESFSSMQYDRFAST